MSLAPIFDTLPYAGHLAAAAALVFLTLVTIIVMLAAFHPDPHRRKDARRLLRLLIHRTPE